MDGVVLGLVIQGIDLSLRCHLCFCPAIFSILTFDLKCALPWPQDGYSKSQVSPLHTVLSLLPPFEK